MGVGTWAWAPELAPPTPIKVSTQTKLSPSLTCGQLPQLLPRWCRVCQADAAQQHRPRFPPQHCSYRRLCSLQTRQDFCLLLRQAIRGRSAAAAAISSRCGRLRGERCAARWRGRGGWHGLGWQQLRHQLQQGSRGGGRGSGGRQAGVGGGVRQSKVASQIAACRLLQLLLTHLPTHLSEQQVQELHRLAPHRLRSDPVPQQLAHLQGQRTERGR